MFTTNSKKLTLILIFCLTVLIALSGCGGGDDSSEEVVVTPVPVDPVADINALVASPKFSFTTKTKIAVNIDIVQNDNQRNHVNIYRDYQLMDDLRYLPNPASRVVSGSLVNGKFTHSFIGLNQQQQYLIEIWTFDGRAPLQRAITVNNNQLTW